MTALLSTLQGDIPGLVRHGSPCRDALKRRVLIQINEDGDYPGLGLGGMSLDLSDPTGRVHAAWWVRVVSIESSAVWRSIGGDDWYLVALAEQNAPMSPEQIDTLARLVLRLAGRV